MTAPEPGPELVITDQHESIVELLRELQRAVLVHPEAARALFKALAAEGRVFAETAEGRHWQERVLESALLERALLVWQSATLWLSEEPDDGTTPSAVIDAVAAAARSPERDLLLEQLFRGG
jgi:hypothetical protein